VLEIFEIRVQEQTHMGPILETFRYLVCV
jgi:hypothetical protein